MHVTMQGHRVYLNPTHMKQHADVLPFLEEALAKITPPEDKTFSKHQVDLGRVIGLSSRVKVRPGDKFIWAQRVHRNTSTRFVLDRQPEPSQFVTIIMSREKRASRPDPTFRILTAFIGEMAEKEIGDTSIRDDERERCIKFWKENALIWGSQETIPGTESDCDCDNITSPEDEEFVYEGVTSTGHPQMYLRTDDGGSDIAVCCTCSACMMPNAGGGMACDSCQHTAYMEAAADYDEGNL